MTKLCVCVCMCVCPSACLCLSVCLLLFCLISDNPTEMTVTWVTLNDTRQTPVVEYGTGGLNLKQTGKTAPFQDGGSEHRWLYVHRVYLKDLTPGARYCTIDSVVHISSVFRR